MINFVLDIRREENMVTLFIGRRSFKYTGPDAHEVVLAICDELGVRGIFDTERVVRILNVTNRRRGRQQEE